MRRRRRRKGREEGRDGEERRKQSRRRGGGLDDVAEHPSLEVEDGKPRNFSDDLDQATDVNGQRRECSRASKQTPGRRRRSCFTEIPTIQNSRRTSDFLKCSRVCPVGGGQLVCTKNVDISQRKFLKNKKKPR